MTELSLRSRTFLTLFIIALFRLGQTLLAPDVKVSALNAATNATLGHSQVWDLLNLISGGGLTRLAVFSVGVCTYLTGSFLMSVLKVVLPWLNTTAAVDGSAASRALGGTQSRYPRFFTVTLGIAQSAVVVALDATGHLFGHGHQFLDSAGVIPLIDIAACMAAGNVVAAWLAGLVTERGIGDGVKLLLCTQVMAVLPAEIGKIYHDKGALVFLGALAAALVTFVGTIFADRAERRIPVQFAKRMIGRRVDGGTFTYLPLPFSLKIINAKDGDLVAIAKGMADRPLYLAMLAGLVWPRVGWLHSFHQESNPWRLTADFALIVLFIIIAMPTRFFPEELADSFAKRGAFIPGIGRGRSTAEYLSYVMNRVTVAAAVYLGILTMIPVVTFSLSGLSNSFPAGTGLFLVLSTASETITRPIL